MRSNEMHILVLSFSLMYIGSNAHDKPCRPQTFGYDSVVCVCDEDYCDYANPALPKRGEYLMVTTNKGGLRFSTTTGTLRLSSQACSSAQSCCDVINNKTAFLSVDRTKTAQKILGFGSAFTDAVGWNLNNVSEKLRNLVINSFYGPDGLKYNIARTTIAHCDFSLNEYYNDDTPYDVNMTDWHLRYEDYNYRLNYIKMARDTTVDELYLVSSLWTPPAWMREMDDEGENLQVKREYYDAATRYILKYLEAMRNEGIKMWGISYANEPFINVGLSVARNIDKIATSWTLNRLAEFATKHFLPALAKEFADVKVLHFDENRDILKSSSVRYLETRTELLQQIEYIALHSYNNQEINPNVVDSFHKKYPNVTILNTEYCVIQKNRLGSWELAELYVTNILEEMNHFTSAWIDWNLVLNTESGPTFTNNLVDATVILDIEKGLMYKQPSFYAMGHFSKFMPRDSVKVQLTSTYVTPLQHAAVLRPDGLIAVVLYNPTDNSILTTVNGDKESVIVTVSPNSINTIVFQA